MARELGAPSAALVGSEAPPRARTRRPRAAHPLREPVPPRRRMPSDPPQQLEPVPPWARPAGDDASVTLEKILQLLAAQNTAHNEERRKSAARARRRQQEAGHAGRRAQRSATRSAPRRTSTTRATERATSRSSQEEQEAEETRASSRPAQVRSPTLRTETEPLAQTQRASKGPERPPALRLARAHCARPRTHRQGHRQRAEREERERVRRHPAEPDALAVAPQHRHRRPAQSCGAGPRDARMRHQVYAEARDHQRRQLVDGGLAVQVVALAPLVLRARVYCVGSVSCGVRYR